MHEPTFNTSAVCKNPVNTHVEGMDGCVVGVAVEIVGAEVGK